MCVTVDVIDKLQRDYFAGRNLGRSIAAFNETEAAAVVAESLEADRILNLPPSHLFGGSFEPLFGPLTDWPRAVMAEILLDTAGLAREMGDEKKHRDFWALAWATLEENLNSPVASPMLWYEDIFFDVGQELRMMGKHRAVDFFKRSLVHDLHFHDGINADSLLMDLAETYLWVGDPDAALEILTALLRNDPSHIWTYNLMAITFDRFGLTDVGARAARRGLELVEATGDPENLHDQLLDSLDDMEQSERRGQEAEVDPEVLADLYDALTLDFDAGERRSPVALSHGLVLDLDQMPVMRPPEGPDLPPPEVLMQWLRTPSAAKAKRDRNPGRNDPCWCGSGKKYKYCHLRSDQGRRS
jgi:tetratricopeptide (TPR) repeat protein